MDDCLDQLYFMACEEHQTMYITPIWEGYAAEFGTGKGFKGVLERCVRDGFPQPNGQSLKPGPYLIVRTDKSIRPDADPILAWVGTLNEDMTVSNGFMPPKTHRVNRWPPKS